MRCPLIGSNLPIGEGEFLAFVMHLNVLGERTAETFNWPPNQSSRVDSFET